MKKKQSPVCWLCGEKSTDQISCLKIPSTVSASETLAMIGRQPSHTYTSSVMTAHYSLGCHKATRWLGMRVTCDWHCSRGLVRVTPEEWRVGGWNQEKQTDIQCNWTPFVYLKLSICSICQLPSQHLQQTKVSCQQIDKGFCWLVNNIMHYITLWILTANCKHYHNVRIFFIVGLCRNHSSTSCVFSKLWESWFTIKFCYIFYTCYVNINYILKVL